MLGILHCCVYVMYYLNAKLIETPNSDMPLVCFKLLQEIGVRLLYILKTLLGLDSNGVDSAWWWSPA